MGLGRRSASRKLALSVGATCVGALLLLGAPGPSGAQDDVGPADSLTPSDVSLTLGVGASATVPETLHLNAAPPKADIVIAVDTTGSMGGAITDAQADAVAIVQRIGTSIPGARFAVVDFKDYPVAPFGGAGDYPYLLRSGLTTDSAQIQAAVNAMTAGGGGDLPESFNRVVYESYSDSNLGRDTGAPAFVVFLGDDLPHDAGQNSVFSSCPNTPPTDLGRDGAASADDLATKTVLDGAKANHVNVSIVVYNPRPSVTSCWSQLSAYTGGQQVTRSGTTSVADQIVDLVNADAARIDEVTFRASPASFNSWLSFTPPPPYGPFTAPIDAQFEETITVPAGTAEGDYTFQVQALADGAIRATQSVTVHVRKQAVTGLQLTSDQRSLPSGLAAVPFTSIPASLIPAFAGNAASTPGGSIPGGSIPGGSIPGGSIPGGSIPGGSITFGSLGLGAIPGGSIPGGSIPGGSIPGGSIGLQTALRSVLLSHIPLTNPSTGATWGQVLAAPSTLTGRPLSTLTLLDVAGDATAWARLKDLPWRDVPLATTRWGGVPLAAWLLGNATLSQLPVPGGHSTWAQALQAAGGSATGLDTTTNTVFGVGIAGQLGQTDIGSIPGGSIPGGSIPGGSIPAREILLSSIRIAATRLATVALADISPVADIVNCGGSFACTGKNLGDAAAAGAIKPSATFGMLLDRLPTTHPARQMTLSELIFGFLAMSQYPFEQLDGQGLQEFSGTGKNVAYHVDFEFDCSIASSFTIGVGLPRGEFPVKGSTTFSFAGGTPVAGADPTSLDKAGATWTARWTSIPSGACGTGMRHVRMSFQAYERLELGEHTAGVSVTANGTYAATQQAPIEVTQHREPDGNPSQATAIQKDTLYFGNIGYAGDLDVYRLPLGGLAPGTKVAAFLKVPGDADFDVVLRKPEAPGVRSSPGGSIPGGSIPIESLAPYVDNDDRPLPPDTLADVPVSTPGGSIPGGSIPGGSIPGGSIPGGSISANRGAATEAAQVVTAGEAGDALIDVSGYLGSHSGQPYVLRVQVTPPPPLPPCQPIAGRNAATPGTLPALSTIPASEKPLYKTLFLVNRQRMVALYGQTEVDELLNSPASPLNVAAARSEVKGLVLPVDGDAAVRTAFAAWDAEPCSTRAANGVVRKINDLADVYKAGLPNIEYVVLLGPDPALPSWRQYDRVQISPEVDEAGELVDFTNDLADPNPLYAAAAQNHFLVDGAYGVRKKISWLGSDLPLPQDSVSRLLESPDQIGEWLQQYIDTGGILDPQTELTTGDEFFTDSADAAHNALLAGFPGILGDTLYPPTSAGWTKNDLLADFFAKSPVPDISALYAHYNPWLAQPAGPVPITSLNELVSTANLPGGDAVEGKIVFTIGCHSGLNIPDIHPGDAAKKNDWAQAYRGAVYVANTGFGYDDTESIALSGRLMWLFAQKLNRGTGSIGEQWVNAVNTYHVTAGNWDVLDEKVMLQATMYGPPWARFRTPVSPPTTPALTTHPDGSLEVASVTMNPTITHHDLPDGRSWWDVAGQTLSVEHRSIQPLATRDVTIPGKHARDPFITSLTVNDLANKKPVRAFPTIRSSLYEPNPNFRNIWWPAIPVTVLESAFGSNLNLIAGQFRPSAEGSEVGTERLINSIEVDIAYSSNVDAVRPLITDAGAVMTGPASARLFLRVTDESGLLTKVAALYNDGVNNFKFKQLELASGDLWTADVTGLAGPPEVIGEARDAAGNVGFSANKAVNFTAVTDGTPPEIAIASPLPGAVFTIGQLIPADYNCSDDGGVESCDGDVAKGANVDTGSAGPKTFTVTAEDLSGNPASESVSYSVRYGFVGFFQPVDNLPVLNSAKAGTTVPLKWKLQTATGQDITTLEAVTSVTSKAIRCPVATNDPVETTVPAALTPLKYDPVLKQYVYTWTTAKAWAGTCREVFVGFRDGTYKSARFQLK